MARVCGRGKCNSVWEKWRGLIQGTMLHGLMILLKAGWTEWALSLKCYLVYENVSLQINHLDETYKQTWRWFIYGCPTWTNTFTLTTVRNVWESKVKIALHLSIKHKTIRYQYSKPYAGNCHLPYFWFILWPYIPEHKMTPLHNLAKTCFILCATVTWTPAPPPHMTSDELGRTFLSYIQVHMVQHTSALTQPTVLL
jgi:hypothetical protein